MADIQVENVSFKYGLVGSTKAHSFSVNLAADSSGFSFYHAPLEDTPGSEHSWHPSATATDPYPDVTTFQQLAKAFALAVPTICDQNVLFQRLVYQTIFVDAGSLQPAKPPVVANLGEVTIETDTDYTGIGSNRSPVPLYGDCIVTRAKGPRIKRSDHDWALCTNYANGALAQVTIPNTSPFYKFLALLNTLSPVVFSTSKRAGQGPGSYNSVQFSPGLVFHRYNHAFERSNY